MCLQKTKKVNLNVYKINFELIKNKRYMAKKKANTKVKKEKLHLDEIVIGGVYKTYVNDLVKIEQKNDDTEQVVLTNITHAYRQWVSYKNIYLTDRIY